MSNWDPTPWAIGGGADNSAETARTAVYASTNGAEGIVNPDDLKVVARDIPGSGVVVRPGGLLARSRYAGADRQTYTGRLGIDDPVDVANTGSSGGRRDLLAIIIDDPSQTGDGETGPADPTNYQYIQSVIIPNVAANVKKLQDVPGYTYATGYALCRISQPANSGTITPAMITDLRNVANPRHDRKLLADSISSTTPSETIASPSGQVWPSLTGGWSVDIPEWATEMIVIGTWSQVIAPTDPSNNSSGALWVRLGTTNDADMTTTQAVTWDTPAAGSSRNSYTCPGKIAIPASFRGKTVAISMMAKVNAGSATALKIDNVSAVSLDVEFIERAA